MKNSDGFTQTAYEPIKRPSSKNESDESAHFSKIVGMTRYLADIIARRRQGTNRQ